MSPALVVVALTVHGAAELMDVMVKVGPASDVPSITEAVPSTQILPAEGRKSAGEEPAVRSVGCAAKEKVTV